MKCPNCGNTKFERLDYAIIKCTKCYSLFDPFSYPGFSVPTVDVGEIWDTSSEDEKKDDWFKR